MVYIIPRKGWQKPSLWETKVKKIKKKKSKDTSRKLGNFLSIPCISLYEYLTINGENFENEILYEGNNIWVGVEIWPLLCVVKISGKKLTTRKVIAALQKIAKYNFTNNEKSQVMTEAQGNPYLDIFQDPCAKMPKGKLRDLFCNSSNYWELFSSPAQCTAQMVINSCLYLEKRDKQNIIICGMDS